MPLARVSSPLTCDLSSALYAMYPIISTRVVPPACRYKGIVYSVYKRCQSIFRLMRTAVSVTSVSGLRVTSPDDASSNSPAM